MPTYLARFGRCQGLYRSRRWPTDNAPTSAEWRAASVKLNLNNAWACSCRTPYSNSSAALTASAYLEGSNRRTRRVLARLRELATPNKAHIQKCSWGRARDAYWDIRLLSSIPTYLGALS
jgi:hypothetical protein